jgi:hypothetical protein
MCHAKNDSASPRSHSQSVSNQDTALSLSYPLSIELRKVIEDTVRIIRVTCVVT